MIAARLLLAALASFAVLFLVFWWVFGGPPLFAT